MRTSKFRLGPLNLTLLIGSSLSGCYINGSVTGLDSLETLTAPVTLTSGKIIGPTLAAAVPLAGVCPPTDSSVEFEATGLKFTFSCQNGSFSSTGDLSPLSEGIYSVTLKSVPSGASSSTTLLRDDTKPTAPGSLTTAPFVTSLTVGPGISWVDSTDSLSGVDHYEVQLLKNSDSSVVAPWTQLTSGGFLTNLSLTVQNHPRSTTKFRKTKKISLNFMARGAAIVLKPYPISGLVLES